MAPLTLFSLPLPISGPPDGYEWAERDISALSTTTAFRTGLDNRDTFLGKMRCIVCGRDKALEHSRIIMQSEPKTWGKLLNYKWIPEQTKSHIHEPRNGMLMCVAHHDDFDKYRFFIRFIPEIQKFVFFNHSDDPTLQMFHGKAVALDVNDRNAPFPGIFVIQEMRVRAFHPWEATNVDISNEIPWQDWVLADGVYDEASTCFKRAGQPYQRTATQPSYESAGGVSSIGRTLALNDDTIANILAASRSLPTWKACQIEGTSWTGKAEENMEQYKRSIGLDSVDF